MNSSADAYWVDIGQGMISSQKKNIRRIYIYIYVHDVCIYIYIYVSVNLTNQAICKLSENFRQFVKCLFKSVNLFFYACKTLEPAFFWYAADTNLFRLGSVNPKKKFPDAECSGAA